MYECFELSKLASKRPHHWGVSICRGVDFLLGTKGKSQYSLSDAPSSSPEFPRDESFHHFCFIYN